MPKIQTDSQHYSDIADAIRDMSGNEETFYPSEMASGVRSIPQTIAIAPIIYSLEEREVGVWTDGKPLYQKTVVGNVLGNSQSQTTLYTCTNEELHMYNLKLKNPDTGGVINANCIFSSTTYNYRCVLDTSNLLLIRSDVYAWAAWFPTTTIWYTKTTDTPGSGTWTPSGVPAHHYSTEEQVIGTWVDGKPLYEKTIHTGNMSTYTNMFATTVSNIKHMVDIQGFGYTSSEQYHIPYFMGNFNYMITACYFPSSNEIRIEKGTSLPTIIDSYVTITYTKTTD